MVFVALLAAVTGPVWGQSFGGGTGTATDPYKISTADHWNQLATNVNNGTTYSGMFFQQTANISVTTVVGYVNGSIPTPSDKAFCGTYDGGEFTLNVTITGYNRYMAPFRYINGATIKNLVVTGSVTSDDGHPSGLVGITGGTCIIENCLVQTNVRGNTYKGGIIGHTLYANITLTGCAYTGTITLGGGYTGGLIGWGGDNGGHTLTITNCFFNGTTSGTGNFHPIGCLSETNVTYTNTRNVSNTYYSVAPSLSDDNYNSFVKDLTYKGKQVYSVTGGTDVTVAKAGTPTLSYNVSGLSFYGSNGGIKCGDAIYGSDGDAVSLTLNHADPAEGYAFDTYSANNGTLTGTNNPYTLTMADANSVITALWKRTYTLLNIPEGWTVTADGQAVNVTDSTATIPPGATVVLTPTNVNLVKKVTLKNPIINLDTVKHNITVRNGWKLTGTLDVEHYPVKISIADGATVTLDSVTINGTSNNAYQWAGINCEGNATIILEGTSSVKGFHENWPGIYVPSGKTLSIKGETAGTDSLTASSNGYGAGIGGGYDISCGNIIIESGTITATGGQNGAGIGGGGIGTGTSCGDITISGGNVTATGGSSGAGIGCGNRDCGNISISGGTIKAFGGNLAAGVGSGNTGTCSSITISGGTVTATGGSQGAGIGNKTSGNISITGGTIEATGGEQAAGIGSGYYKGCGDIEITNGVTQVTATMGTGATYSIGAGTNGTCGTVSIGGTDYGTGATPNQSDGKTFMYPYLLATPLTLEAITDGTIVVSNPKSGMQYSLNGAAKQPLSGSEVVIQVNAHDKVAFYGNGTNITTYDGTSIAGGSADVKVYGNIMSLVNETAFATATTLTEDFTFSQFFSNNIHLTDASSLQLPATTLAEGCYGGMFSGCTSLINGPTLPAPTLTWFCYYYMFDNCINLTSVTCMATNISADDCIFNWLYNVESTGTLYVDGTMTGANWNVPSTWTVVAKP